MLPQQTPAEVADLIRTHNQARGRGVWSAYFEFTGPVVEVAIAELRSVDPRTRIDGSSQIVRVEFEPGAELRVAELALARGGVLLKDLSRIT